MEIMNDIKVIPANGINGTKGQYIESITLSPKTFGNWTLSTIPEDLVRQELGKSIAKAIEYDTHIVQDPRTQRPMIKASTVVYMKPDNVAMYEEIQALKTQIASERLMHNDEIRKVDELLREMTADKEECLKQWAKFSDLYHEYWNKDQDWEHHVRRFPITWWRGTKEFLIELINILPFR